MVLRPFVSVLACLTYVNINVWKSFSGWIRSFSLSPSCSLAAICGCAIQFHLCLVFLLFLSRRGIFITCQCFGHNSLVVIYHCEERKFNRSRRENHTNAKQNPWQQKEIEKRKYVSLAWAHAHACVWKIAMKITHWNDVRLRLQGAAKWIVILFVIVIIIIAAASEMCCSDFIRNV